MVLLALAFSLLPELTPPGSTSLTAQVCPKATRTDMMSRQILANGIIGSNF